MVESQDFRAGDYVPLAQMSGLLGVEGGQDRSPQLSWEGFPRATRSFVVTALDPDAPTGSGYWHWALVDVPATIRSLPAGIGTELNPLLPKPSFQIANDARVARYVGAAPSAGGTEQGEK